MFLSKLGERPQKQACFYLSQEKDVWVGQEERLLMSSKCILVEWILTSGSSLTGRSVCVCIKGKKA